MSFVQIVDLHTKNVDEIQSLEREWEQATEGKRTLRRSIIGRDRNDPDHYVVVAFFDSYESAMTNSNLAETGEFGRKQTELLDEPIGTIKGRMRLGLGKLRDQLADLAAGEFA